jgi:hypothetical protein
MKLAIRKKLVAIKKNAIIGEMIKLSKNYKGKEDKKYNEVLQFERKAISENNTNSDF